MSMHNVIAKMEGIFYVKVTAVDISLVPRPHLLRNKVNRVWYNATKFWLQALESRRHQSDYRYAWNVI